MRELKRCPKCRQTRYLERHHVFPVRYYGRKGNSPVFNLCTNCHREIEVILTEAEKGRGQLSDKRYIQIMLSFLGDV